MTEKPYFKKRGEELVTGLKKIYDEKQDSYAKKRFTVLYSIDENPFEWDLMDNQKDCLIVKGNGTAICDLLNELNNENEQLKQYIYDNLDEDICDVCSYQYLEKSQMDKYYVAKCEKGYDNCSKGTVIHCKDFKFKELE